MGKHKDDGWVTLYSYEVVEETSTEESAPTTTETWTTSCAWCLKEQKLPMGNGSHGICDRHSAQMVAAAAERRRSRGRS